MKEMSEDSLINLPLVDSMPIFVAEVYAHIDGHMDSSDRELQGQKGAVLRLGREESGLSEEDVAESVGVSAPFLILVEEGMIPESAMPPDFVYRYAQAIGHMGLLHEYARRFRAPRYVRARLRRALGSPIEGIAQNH